MKKGSQLLDSERRQEPKKKGALSSLSPSRLDGCGFVLFSALGGERSLDAQALFRLCSLIEARSRDVPHRSCDRARGIKAPRRRERAPKHSFTKTLVAEKNTRMTQQEKIREDIPIAQNSHLPGRADATAAKRAKESTTRRMLCRGGIGELGAGGR